MSATAAASGDGTGPSMNMMSEVKDIPKLPRIKQDDENMEKLHLAARRGNPDGIKRLVANGVDPLVANKFGATAFSVAVRFGKVSVLQCLLEGPLAEMSIGDLLIQPWHGRRPILLAVEFEHRDVLDFIVETAQKQKVNLGAILQECDDYHRSGSSILGETVLHYCVSNRKLDLVQLFLKLGASPNAKDRHSETVLMRAIKEHAHEEFFELVASPDIKVDSMDRNGNTALLMAIENQHEDMARKLVELGADCNFRVSVEGDPSGVSMPFFATRACMTDLLQDMLPLLDPYCISEFKMRAFEATSKEQMPWYDETTQEQQSAMSKILTDIVFASPARDANASSGKQKTRWTYKDEDSTWKDMSAKDTKAIDQGAKNNPGSAFRLKMGNGRTYLIDVNAMTETNMKSGKPKSIKRVVKTIMTAADLGSPAGLSPRGGNNVRQY